MIRTAILASIFLVLLSIAYSRPGALPENVQKVAAMIEEQPAAKAPAPAQKQTASVSAPKPERAAAPPAVAANPVTPSEPSPPAGIARKEEALDVPAPAAPPPVVTPAPAAVAQDARPLPALPTSLMPSETPRTQVASTAQPSSLRNPVPLVPPADEPARIASPALLPAEDMPLINVPARPVVAPWEAPPRPRTATTVAVANPGPSDTAAKQPEDTAPKLMTPQERSRELYRLAHEMEDTFIRKLAR
ncbi:MAG: hypothetical protein ACYCZX_00020 [Rhodospirillaceae bacterium]